MKDRIGSSVSEEIKVLSMWKGKSNISDEKKINKIALLPRITREINHNFVVEVISSSLNHNSYFFPSKLQSLLTTITGGDDLDSLVNGSIAFLTLESSLFIKQTGASISPLSIMSIPDNVNPWTYEPV